MEVIDYFKVENKEYWLKQIEKSDWGAGRFLYRLLNENRLKESVGENTKVLMLVDKNNLLSFCTYAEKDDIQPTTLTPWLGWVYTYPEYRGHHYFRLLLDAAIKFAISEGKNNLYVSTNHIGLYEKYGFIFYGMLKDLEGNDSRVYCKKINNGIEE